MLWESWLFIIWLVRKTAIFIVFSHNVQIFGFFNTFLPQSRRHWAVKLLIALRLECEWKWSQQPPPPPPAAASPPLFVLLLQLPRYLKLLTPNVTVCAQVGVGGEQTNFHWINSALTFCLHHPLSAVNLFETLWNINEHDWWTDLVSQQILNPINQR